MLLADLIAERVRTAIAGALNDTKDLLTGVAQAGGREAAHDTFSDIGSLSDVLGVLVDLAALLTGPVGLAWDALQAAEGAGGKLGAGFGLGYLFGYAAFQAIEPVFEPLNHFIADKLTTEIFDPMTAAGLVAKRIITAQFGQSESSGGNLDSQHFNDLTEAARQYPELAELLDLWRRGNVGQGDVEWALRRHAVPEDWIPHLLTLQRVLLSPADLALAELRGIITHDEATKYAARLGVDEPDFATLIGNTGEPLGLMELLEAYRRGFIDKPRLERGIRQSRVRNEWIPTAEALRFAPMSTSDAVRAVVEHHLTDNEGKKIAEQNGLLPEHWETLVQSWGRPLAHGEMLELYYRGLATRGQVDQAMRESDIKDKYTKQSFELGRRLLPERLIVDAIKYGALSPKEGARKLLEKGYNEQDTEILIRLGVGEQKKTAKDLTRAEIMSLYGEGLLHRQDAVAKLEHLGYNNHDAELEITLADTRAHATAIRQESSHIRNSYLDGRLTSDQAIAQLTNVGVEGQQARHLVDTWTRERGRASRILTPTQIVKAAKNTVITFTDARTQLVALGYTEGDATTLLLENGVAPHQ